MSVSHAVVWLDHEHADVIRIAGDVVTSHRLKASHHDTGQHHSGVRTQHEFFGTVCDAMAEFTMVLVTGSHMIQSELRHYIEKHRASLQPTIAGWETVDRPTEPELVARARVFFRAHDNMIGQHTMR
jgi:stalled ribosome rescue protein Dom34